MSVKGGGDTRLDGRNQITKNKSLIHSKSKSNKKVFTHFKGEDKGYTLDSDIPLNELERPRFKAETLTMTHPVSNELFRQLKGKTKTDVYGIQREVRNVYFKMKFINEYGEEERGYLLDWKLDGQNQGIFKFQIANEEIN